MGSRGTKFESWLEAEREVSRATRALHQALSDFGPDSAQYQARSAELHVHIGSARMLCDEVLAEFSKLAAALNSPMSTRGPRQ